ncbi:MULTISPECIES: GyrI-like domain-containing protein [Paenibacillus]|uniref:GyrI-like domain-containing protein n=1 Tax=Paenibacillus TaxID=44249 RepID=UPI0022B858D3|nr:GyrI-like domain-containing protein [Paenibacillus caseinilyticus]MCZ8521554.1 GyrI-like domain-containing protein [Paenibacillus caseinilyticus]
MPTLTEQWNAFMPRTSEITGRGAATLGICYGVDAGDGEPFDYVTGAVVTEVPAELPAGMLTVTLEPRLYAVFTHKGPVALLDQTYALIHE